MTTPSEVPNLSAFAEAERIALRLDRDAVAAAQVKTFVPPRRLIELIDLPDDELADHLRSRGWIVRAGGTDDEE